MSDYYCSHNPPCCPQINGLKAEVENKRLIIKEMQECQAGLEENCKRWAEKIERYEKRIKELEAK